MISVICENLKNKKKKQQTKLIGTENRLVVIRNAGGEGVLSWGERDKMRKGAQTVQTFSYILNKLGI